MNQKSYTPQEAAKRLGMSIRMLGYYRSIGKIKGTKAGSVNAYFYSEEQLREGADAIGVELKPDDDEQEHDDDDEKPTLALATA